MTLGIAAVLLLFLMIPTGFYVVLAKTAAGHKSIDDAGFNLIGLTLGFTFAFVGLASRKRPAVHKRLMLFATLMLTAAAADRVAIVFGLQEIRTFRKLLTVFPSLALIAFDTIFRRRVLLLDISIFAIVWLVTWYSISDVIFLHPVGEALIQLMLRLVPS